MKGNDLGKQKPPEVVPFSFNRSLRAASDDSRSNPSNSLFPSNRPPFLTLMPATPR